MDMKALRPISSTNILLKRWMLSFKNIIITTTIARKGIHINKKSIMKQKSLPVRAYTFTDHSLNPRRLCLLTLIFLNRNPINNLSLSRSLSGLHLSISLSLHRNSVSKSPTGYLKHQHLAKQIDIVL